MYENETAVMEAWSWLSELRPVVVGGRVEIGGQGTEWLAHADRITQEQTLQR